ncbi:hypothetical protein [Brevibacterium mcbrellneri]|uniref:hypothetical protein n=1 Tax=Brevibacterium mcbrellneri TaxID=53363 RepID=UPI00030C0955|nr:hypothetical protein [Brevibacterium mcbrellneri]
MKWLTRAAVAAAAIALVVPVSGCAALLSNQQTHNYVYHGGDGAWASLGGVDFRGILLIANEDNTEAQLFYTIVNNSQGPATVTVKVGDYQKQIKLAKGEKIVQNPQSPGFDGEEALVKGLSAQVGEQVDVEVTANNMDKTVRAQLLNADHWYYEDAQPKGSSTSTPTESASETPTEGATEGEATPTPEETEGQ